MRRDLARPNRHATADDGFGLPETLAALLIFALISLGLLHTLLSVMSLSRDARARQVATNLAAQTIDAARQSENLFDLLDDEDVVELNGDEFTIRTTSQWVSDPSVTLNCGTGGGILRYKRINVEVTWAAMRTSTNPVRSDTVLNPDERINDPSRGSILVSVLDGDGGGSAGVTVSATPLSGGAPVASQTTDAQGCAYMLLVEPGDYRIGISRSGYIDVNQQPTATRDVSVVAGSSASASFQYDLASSYTANLVTTVPGPVELPSNLDITFVSTYGRAPMTGGSGTTRTFALHPFASGYSAFAGTCEGADPAAWPAGTDGADTLEGLRAPAVAAAPGDTAALDVPLGLVEITVSAGPGNLRFVPAPDPAAEHPECAVPVDLLLGPGTGARVVALPFGSWQVFQGNAASQTTPVTTLAPLTRGVVTGDVVTLDARTVVAP